MHYKNIIVGVVILLLAGLGIWGTKNFSISPDLSTPKIPDVQNINGNSGTTLDLSGHGLSAFPKYVLSMTGLRELNLSENQLTGAIPAEIRHLQNLRKLNLSYNKMTGLPAELGQLNDLEELDVSFNRLTGLPYELGNLKNLKILNLAGNDYSSQDLNVILKSLPNVTVIK